MKMGPIEVIKPNTSIPAISVENFVILVKDGINAWSQAGEILVKLVEENPNVYTEIIRKTPTITFEMLLAFERMGRKQIYPPLLMDSSPGAKRLLELPYDVQERCCKDPVEVVIDASNGVPVTAKKYIKELSEYESRVLFSSSAVRTIGEQAEFVKTHNKQGRKPHVKRAKVIGTYVLKVSPSGALVAEKTTEKALAAKIYLHVKDGVKQVVVNICE